MMIAAAIKMRIASIRPEKSSNLPWPNAWPESGGSDDFLTEKKGYYRCQKVHR